MDGHYDMRLPVPGPELALAVSLRQDGGTALTATLTGTRRPVTTAALAATVLRHPLAPQRVSALIRRHGIALWLRRLPVVRRPSPPRTTTAPRKESGDRPTAGSEP
ncbi:hypothetical protein BJF78_08105 [Pseudonocardia sp. CNS-139]|nr:hypothetical protein BJF78_08105 [Pseudonocardia sp. CNS-139]